jgi:type III secretion protein R
MKRVFKFIKKKWIVSSLAGLGVMLLSGVVYAQKMAGAGGVSRPLVLLIILAALALAPFIIMMATAFVKMAVVMSLMRNAIGTQQVPPNIVVTGLAMILTIYVMTPVGYQIYRSAGEVINQGTNQPLLSQTSIQLLVKAVDKGKEPMRAFLLKHVHKKEQALFYNMARKMQPVPEDRDAITENDFLNLIPAFAISELSEAFQIGFVLFLPFLIIDIVTANILLSLGMFQISPITLALPFKLLLFVLVDGWHLIVKGLVIGYV